MSLTIALLGEHGDDGVSMNWLRNPFGLCQWAEDNAGLHYDHDTQRLWHVINHWSYTDAPHVDRRLFRAVVLQHWECISVLEQGYFVFNLRAYRQFVEPHSSHLQHRRSPFGSDFIAGSKYTDDQRLMIPMEQFTPSVFSLNDPSLERYQAWFYELVQFAELLQDTRYTYYCSN